jgi:hypothetical protein
MQTTFPLSNVLDKLSPKQLRQIAANQSERDRKLAERNKQRRDSNEPPEFDPIRYADAEAESVALENFLLQPDAEARERDHSELLFEFHEKEAAMSEILKTATPDERQKLLGFETPVMPELPGVARQFKHVPGTLEIVREKIAQLEKELPRVRLEAARYRHIKASFRHPAVIALERNRRVERALTVAGKSVQPRGAMSRNMMSRTVTP